MTKLSANFVNDKNYIYLKHRELLQIIKKKHHKPKGKVDR